MAIIALAMILTACQTNFESCVDMCVDLETGRDYANTTNCEIMEQPPAGILRNEYEDYRDLCWKETDNERKQAEAKCFDTCKTK